ncbi:UNVERIFIED_CONTAM: hypothetical protein FKN15_044049 [Acipenser sinensis]
MILNSCGQLRFKPSLLFLVRLPLVKFSFEQAAGVYHRESRKGRYQLTYKEAKAVCKYEGGNLASHAQLEAARKIGFHVCAAGWFDKGRVGYPIVKSGSNCGYGRVGIIDYGYRLNKSERWDVYCYNPTAKQCGGVLTDQRRVIQSPGYPDEYEDKQICYWHIRVRYGQQIHLRFLDFDVEDDPSCLADFLEVFDSYDDISGFSGRFCGDELPEDFISTAKQCGGVLTDQRRVIQSPGYPDEYEDKQICYWHIRVRYGQQIHLRFLDFDVEDDPSCLADFLEVFDSYDDISGFSGRFCGDELPEDFISTGNVMTLKFLSDSSVSAGGFKLEYVAVAPASMMSNTTIAANESTVLSFDQR